jgi:hypothetical protein
LAPGPHRDLIYMLFVELQMAFVAMLLVQVSHILATYRERYGRYFFPPPIGRDVATYPRIHASSVVHPARLRRSAICASQIFI